MNNKDNFSELRQLLKLKRHEVPPPGYFNNFSGKVLGRIRAGEAGGEQTFADRLQAQAPWLANFLAIFETRPGLIGGVATSLCLLLLLGIVFTENADSPQKNVLGAAVTADSQSASVVTSVTAPVAAASPETTGLAISTNPAVSLQPVATLFGQQDQNQNLLFQSASFTGGNN